MVALSLRLFGAILLEPWHDEYFSIWVVQGFLGQMLDALRQDAGPPLPYLLAKLLTLAGAAPLVAIRAVSVFSGTLAAIFLGAAAKAVCSPRAGLWACWLLAVHPLAVMWGSEGRAYALLSLAVAGSLWAQGSGGERGKTYLLAGFLTLGLYTHALGLLWFLAIAGFAFFRRHRSQLLACGIASLLFLPWLPIMLQQPREAVAWMGKFGMELPSWAHWLGPFRLLPPVASWGYTLEAPLPHVFFQVVAAAATLLALAGGRGFWWPFLLPTSFLTAGWALGLPVFFPGRGEALFLAPAVALMACGMARWPKVSTAGFLAFSLAGSFAIFHYWKSRPPRPEGQIAAWLQKRAASGVLVTTGWWWLGMWYRLSPSWQIIHVPAAALEHPGWFLPGRERVRGDELAKLKALLAKQARHGGAAVLLTPGLPETARLRQMLRELRFAPALGVPSGILYVAKGSFD